MRATELPIGARVHHCGAIYSFGWTVKQQTENPRWGWGTIVDRKPQHDGTVGYKIQRDAALMSNIPNDPTWWASNAIDNYYIPEEIIKKNTDGYDKED